MSIPLDEIRRAKEHLVITMKGLRSSINEAAEKMSSMYGDTHHSVVRLRSYFPALDRGEMYAAELDSMIRLGDFEKINHVSLKIKAISEMIKNDARDLLLSLHAGEEVLPDDVIFH